MLRMVSEKFILGLLIGLGFSPMSASAQSFEVLHTFQGDVDGAQPIALTFDDSGNLYIATDEGGSSACEFGCGTIFAIEASDEQKTLYRFSGGSDGDAPSGLNWLGGTLYGTTSFGGNSGCSQKQGCGTVFKLGQDGTKTTLLTFQGGKAGGQPVGNLVLGADNHLYGTTFKYGSKLGWGMAYKLSLDGDETILHAFNGKDSILLPEYGLIANKNGWLYGSADGGPFGFGVIFKLNTKGKVKTVYGFQGEPDGESPISNLVADRHGNIYGASVAGGKNCNDILLGCGAIFEITPKGEEHILYMFGGGEDGTRPAAVALDNKDNLYGLAQDGRNGGGVLFELSLTGKLTVLHSFDKTDGSVPYTLISDAQGNLFGTTLAGGGTGCGGTGCGVVFEFMP